VKHELPAPTLIEELEKSIAFFERHGDLYKEEYVAAVKELREVFKKNRAARSSREN
jgi:hypothetical protein